MPLIPVPVVVQADGIVRPSIGRQEARAAESGIVHSVRIADGAQVNAGDTLLTLDMEGVVARLTLLDSIAQAQTEDLADLAVLLAASDTALSRVDVRSAHRRQQLREHVAIDGDLTSSAALKGRQGDRVRQLHSRGFATAEQVEQAQELEHLAYGAVRAHREQIRTQWSNEYAFLTAERRRIETERSSLMETLSQYAVVAPVAGTVELTALLSPGSVLQRGEQVATISPNTALIAETWLTPRDIGLVRTGTSARLMIDAFNYRDWGVIDAVVSDIADDASLERDGPRFRVRSRLTRTELRLPAGQRVSIKKGMTFRARFVIAERSLLQLIVDDIDDWLNPARTASAMPSAR